MANSVVFPRAQFFSNSGRPLVGGRIHTYVAGSSTRARTYQDAANVQINTNPIILDARGEAAIYLVEGVEYKFVVEDSTGALIMTQEPVYGAIWPNAAEWPSDATLSYQYMTEAKAAASAIGPVKFFDTKAQADAAIGTLANGDILEISQDETRAGARTRYKVQAGALVFVVNLDQLRLDLANDTDPAKGAALVGGVGQVVSSIAALRLLPKAGSQEAFVLGYYGKGDGGGGSYWLDLADITSPDNGGSIIVAADGGRWKLTWVGELSIRQFGAKGDGVTDDAPCLRGTMAALITRGGGHLYVPKGTYYLNSGDPRGLYMMPITGKDEYYTICEVGSGVTVYGDGDATVFLYNPNRVGEYLNANPGDGIFRGDAGALFANFRVRENSNTPYVASSFHVRDFKTLFTPLTNQTKDYIEGQVVRIYSLGGSITNGDFTAINLNVANNPGHQILSYEKVSSFVAERNRIYSPGFSSNPSNSDHSCFYVTGTRAVYSNNFCSGSSPNKNSTFIETHCAYNDASHNTCFGMNVFINAVSQITHPAPEYDFSQFRVSNNYAREVQTFVVDFCYTQNRKSTLEISNNVVILLGATTSSTEALLKYANDSGADPALVLPTGQVVIRDNVVSVSGVAGEVVYGTSSDALINHAYITNLMVEGNEFRNARRGIINLTGTRLRSVRIANNRIAGSCSNGNGAVDLGARISRSSIVCTFVPGGAVESFDVVDNTIVNSYPGAAPSYGVLLANFSGGFVNTKISLRRNAVTGANSRDLIVDAQGANTHANDTISVLHDHSIFDSVSTFQELVALGAPMDAIRSGSVGSFFGTETTMFGASGGGKVAYTSSVGTAIPTTRYWFQGSTVRNIAPAPSGAIGWVCTGAGVPGTWKTYGSIAA